jgi:hypothetical protein
MRVPPESPEDPERPEFPERADPVAVAGPVLPEFADPEPALVQFELHDPVSPVVPPVV